MEDLTPQPELQPQPQPKNYRWVVTALVWLAGLVVAVTLLTQSNFLEGFLKLIGAGASVIDSSITLTYNPATAPDVANFDFIAKASGESFAKKTVALTDASGMITFRGMGLLAGESYIIKMTVSGQPEKDAQFEFVATDKAIYEFSLNSFSADGVTVTGESGSEGSADLNGDGAVDSREYSEFLRQMQESATAGSIPVETTTPTS